MNARSLFGHQPGPAAIARVRKYLERRNPYLAAVDAEVRDAAELCVRQAIDAPTEIDVIGWAVYLRRAALGLYGEDDARTRDMGRLVIELTNRRGAPTTAVNLVPLSTNRINRGIDAGKVIADRFSMVDLLHTRGLCEAAEREALAALFQWAWHHDDAPDVTHTYLVETLAVLDYCGRAKQGTAVINAYGAMLPEEGTDECALFRSSVRLSLGNCEQIQRHQDVCGIRRSRPSRLQRSYEDLRATVLRHRAHGQNSRCA